MSDDETKVSQVRGRFNRVAPDFDRAAALAKFSLAQRLLLQQAREESWTKASLAQSPDPLPFRLNLTALARELGLGRSHLSVQFGRLVAARVFEATGDGSYLIVKDYRRWVDAAGRPLLAPAEVAWCRAALKLWRRPRREAAQTAEPADPSSPTCSVDCNALFGGLCGGVRSVVTRCSVDCDALFATSEQSGPSPQTPIEERAGLRARRETLNTETIKEAAAANSRPDTRDTPAPASAPACAREAPAPPSILPATPPGPPDPALVPPYPGDRPGLLDLTPGPHELGAAEARALFVRVWETWGRADLCNAFYARQREHSAAAWRAAIQSLAVEGRRVGSIQLVHLRAVDLEARPAGHAAPGPARRPRAEPHSNVLRAPFPPKRPRGGVAPDADPDGVKE